jgi:hypothetical protein
MRLIDFSTGHSDFKKVSAHMAGAPLINRFGESVGKNSKLTTTISTPRFIDEKYR